MATLVKIQSLSKFLKKPDTSEMTMSALARNCHEMGNCLFTKFGILAQQYTNDLTNHGIVLQACVVLIQLSIELGSMHLFNVAEIHDELNNT